MNKDVVYSNIFNLINGGFFEDKYIELSSDIRLENKNDVDTIKRLEEISANLFNSIIIGAQLIEDENEIMRFVEMFCNYLEPFGLLMNLHEFDLDDESAMNRLKHGFGVHFTTTKIANLIKKQGVLKASSNNGLLSEEEMNMIKKAADEQKKNNPDSINKGSYLNTGFGVGVSSYGAMTNYFWMYHTPESLSFLFGDIASRNKRIAMKYINDCTNALDAKFKDEVRNKLSEIYDRLIGEEQQVGCILIDRDAIEYEKVKYYYGGNVRTQEIRPYSNSLDSLMDNDIKISNDIDVSKLKFIKIPTILELEKIKEKQLSFDNIQRR